MVFVEYVDLTGKNVLSVKQESSMKVITIQMDLVIDEDMSDKYDIAIYLTDKLYKDPEFFGDFGEENIVEVKDMD